MNCRRFHDELFEYVDGTLSADELTAAEKHLAECEACRQAVEKERRLASALSSRLRQSTQSLTLRPEIRRNIVTASRKRGSALIDLWKYWVRMAVIPGAALLIAGVLLAGHFSGTRRHETVSVPVVPLVSEVASAAGNSPQAPVLVQMSYRLPTRQFHQEGNLVVDTLVDETVDADGVFQASGKETISPKLEMKTPL
ncbi:MAG TPA: anti-sigma factor [Candidatus Sulfotelmatobacter sp.]|nr:anti-sigma factor [Candidatus Sulfotelmatobacter sp.]